jgi:VWFA-related protein
MKPSTRVSREDGRAIRMLALLLLVLCAGAIAAEPPLKTVDVLRFLKAGVSEHTAISELQSRGFGEALTMERESVLREAGATETLIVAIRRVSPELPPATPRVVNSDGETVAVTSGAAGATFSASAREVRVPVAVLDKNGEPVMGLLATDFKISEEGRPQPVTLFSGERRALRLALALDVSGSMRSKVSEVEGALRHFIDLLEPKDEILVLTFNEHIQVLQDFTSDRDRLAQVLDTLEPDGGTALYDAAAESIRRVSHGPAESKAVVLVTDGVDTASRVSFAELLEQARRSEVPVFSIGLDVESDHHAPPGGMHHGGHPGGGHHGGGGFGGGGGGGGGFGGPGMMHMHSREGFDAGPLKSLADETGGMAPIVKDLGHYSPDSDERKGDQLKAAVETIAMLLRHRYLLGYDAPPGKGWRKIHVEVDRAGASERARKGYYAGG